MQGMRLIDVVREASHFLGGSKGDYDPLVSLIGDARFVLLGEATHGSHELYRERARITQRLVAELGFNAVVVEGDWPDAERVDRFVKQRSTDASALDALAGFDRFPAWMWRNGVVAEFVSWLRSQGTAGFYGMDLYSLYGSIAEVLRYLDRTDPHAAQRARRRYACFDHHGRPQAYGKNVARGKSRGCAEEVVAQLLELQRRAARGTDPELFSAEQNARLARNAEQYYRSMFGSRVTSWNLRDRHMAETIETVARHLERREGRARVVVWAHNSHLGDARATGIDQVSVGQLLRERWGRKAVLVGFTTYDGTVTAAHDWDAPPEKMKVRPALPGSVEHLFHEVGLPRFFLPLRDPGEGLGALHEPMLQRAIGVVYRPQTERQSHYFEARIAAQFDAVVHVDRARAVEPLETGAQAGSAEPPETWPSAL